MESPPCGGREDSEKNSSYRAVREKGEDSAKGRRCDQKRTNTLCEVSGATGKINGWESGKKKASQVKYCLLTEGKGGGEEIAHRGGEMRRRFSEKRFSQDNWGEIQGGDVNQKQSKKRIKSQLAARIICLERTSPSKKEKSNPEGKENSTDE